MNHDHKLILNSLNYFFVENNYVERRKLSY